MPELRREELGPSGADPCDQLGSSPWHPPSVISLSLRHPPSIMADSDEEYVGNISEDEADDKIRRRSRGAAGPVSKRRKQKGGAEFEISRTWETLVEGADGTINSTVEGLLEASKRKR